MIDHLNLKRVLFSQLKVGEVYYECYTDSRDTFLGFDGYCAIFKNNVFFAYKKCEFYTLIPFKEIIQRNMIQRNMIQRNMELRALEKEKWVI